MPLNHLRLGRRSRLTQECAQPAARRLDPAMRSDCAFCAPAPVTQQPAHQPSRLSGAGKGHPGAGLISRSALARLLLALAAEVPSGTRAWSPAGLARAGPCRRAGPQPVPRPSGGRKQQVPMCHRG